MWIAVSVVVFVCLLVCPESSAVVMRLDNATYDQVTRGDKFVLVQFYVKWSSVCQKLEPKWEDVERRYRERDDVVIGKVNAQEDRILVTRFRTTTFPTIFYYPKGVTEHQPYEGRHTIAAFVELIEQHAPTTWVRKVFTKELNSTNFDEIVMDKDKFVMLQFYNTTDCYKCKKLQPDYEMVAETFHNERTIIVARVDTEAHPEIGERFSIEHHPRIMWFTRDNKRGIPYQSAMKPLQLVDFINHQCHTARELGGGLTSQAGRMVEMDAVVSNFIASIADVQKEAEKVKDKMAGRQHPHFNYSSFYMDMLDRIGSRGYELVTMEITNLQNSLATSPKSMPEEEKEDLIMRVNILRSFQKAYRTQFPRLQDSDSDEKKGETAVVEQRAKDPPNAFQRKVRGRGKKGYTSKMRSIKHEL
ncbi:uncharacterized protein LOC144879411 [Branchiostoma floridae x Branchiostoma japonicum]